MEKEVVHGRREGCSIGRDYGRGGLGLESGDGRRGDRIAGKTGESWIGGAKRVGKVEQEGAGRLGWRVAEGGVAGIKPHRTANSNT